ncbi:TrmH family RNA methyltransferase [Psychroflexus aestuariivivens]|uniref:TrmH family RNA methyltransferase n=1 Tax=Psychroflexus aestuariivivens TaxID=1795040 RepID=UPI000FDA4C54|nr:RNA methyltransferase [Psychroflexus aestuariivivens]
MLSKSQIKLIKSLNQKKYRNMHGLFVAEGVKVIKEFLKSSIELHALYAIADIFHVEEGESHIISEKELKSISNLKTPQTALAVFKIPKVKEISSSLDLKIALDGVRDPGNLGTIIRLCDWFGVKEIICSNDTVDCFNSKVVQATMGSLARVNLHYKDLVAFVSETNQPTYAAVMDGENIYQKEVNSQNAIIVLGNEANGISKEIEDLVSDKICIPQFGQTKDTESLNVATASSIFLSEFRRR